MDPHDFSPSEPLRDRTIHFRDSTFRALKSFVVAHQRRTGEALTNSAAVDLLLRKQLVRELHPGAIRTMQALTRPGGVASLQAIPSGPDEDAPARPLEAPPSRARIGLIQTPRGSRSGPPAGSVIGVSVSKPPKDPAP